MNKQLCLISGRPTIKRLTFQTTVKKLFQGKVIIFLCIKAEGLSFVEKQISPADCKINFAVPSDLILAEHLAVYRYSSDHL